MDTLDTILDSVRLDASLLSRASLRAPFAIESGRLPYAVFHGVVHGECHAYLSGSRHTVRLVPGHLVLIPRGDNHVLAYDLTTPPAPHSAMTAQTRRSGRVPDLQNHDAGPEQCRIICGSVTLDHEAASWMFELLPALIHAGPTADGSASWTQAMLGRLDAELDGDAPGMHASIKRFTELLVVHVLRTFATSPGATGTGWVAAIRDPKIGKALAFIHNRPETCKSVPELASKIGMSRSRFFERFTDLVGIPPARYMTRWRVTKAASLMRHDHLSTEEIADRVGYASVESFRTAFRRHIGKTVLAYRRSISEPA